MTPTIQISLDVTTIEAAMTMARAAIAAGVDWLEAGTPLLLGEGVRGIHALRAAFPDVPIVADIKAMDGAGFEADMMFKAGANMAVVMGQAHDASIIQQVKVAQKHGGKVMVDLMLCPDKPARARQAQELGADIIIVHTGYDERNMVQGLSPLYDLPAVLKAVSIPVQAVGGLTVEQAIQTLELGAQIVVFGEPLVLGGSSLAASDVGYEAMLRDIVQQVKSMRRAW